MNSIEFDPATRLPLNVLHENSTGWGPALLAQYGAAALEEEVLEELKEDIAACVAAGTAGAISVHAGTERDVTFVTASVRCTAPACIAHGAALDTLNALPDRSSELHTMLTATRQLASPVLLLGDIPDPAAAAWRTGVLHTAVVELAAACQHAARRTPAAAEPLASAVGAAQCRLVPGGLDIHDYPGVLTRLPADDPALWARAAALLATTFTELAAVADLEQGAAARG
ncbi:hypothetical protein ACFYZ9_33910 [Streptomyces sp. NPDC001691]|uniref:hypothetical protein n=1 Tax=Streptomyces sp. NPDC001691 TaxID=3364600 RepID=UPI0036C9A3BB